MRGRSAFSPSMGAFTAAQRIQRHILTHFHSEAPAGRCILPVRIGMHVDRLTMLVELVSFDSAKLCGMNEEQRTEVFTLLQELFPSRAAAAPN